MTQVTSHDSGLAPVVALTGVSIGDVWAAAIKIGPPKIDKHHFMEEHIAKLLMQLGKLVDLRWKKFTLFDAMAALTLL